MRPAEILSKDSLSLVISEIRIIESMLSINNQSHGQDSTKRLVKSYYDKLFDKYQITDSIYYKSLLFFEDNPAEMEEILQQSINILVRKQSEAKYEPKKP
ncbi:MAG: DUF4296 domain-containing protein [Bacteroidetes bacterium]|nr:DUF4296 domain-containing protein [Bacteroidota bacterium]MBU1719407.1 DUF4296 domain-containing protein [Bacteroidota bacterium]